MDYLFPKTTIHWLEKFLRYGIEYNEYIEAFGGIEVIDDYFVGVIFALFVLMSPFLAMIERLVVGLSGLLVVLIPFIILTCPIFFVAGIVLVIGRKRQ